MLADHRTPGSLTPDTNSEPKFNRLVLVTRFFPFPAHTGAYRYTEFLITVLSGLAKQVSVVCADRQPESQPVPAVCPDNVDFFTFPPRTPTAAQRALAFSPNATLAFAGDQAAATLRQVLSGRPDLVVIDHVGASWALAHIPDDHPLVYCTHNDEYLARLSFARAQSGLRAVPHMVDAFRLRARDAAMAKRANMMTAISKHDLNTQTRRYRPNKTLHVPPAWLGDLPVRLDVEATPRAVCHFGSLIWQAKRLNLRRFLTANGQKLAEAGVDVLVAGNVEADHLARFRADFPHVQFLGKVDDEGDVLRRARIGVLCGEIGGGFRMTALTYAAHGVPIAARPDLVEDLGLSSPDGFISFDADRDAADAIIAAIDRMDRLKAMGAQLRQRAQELSSVDIARHKLAGALTSVMRGAE